MYQYSIMFSLILISYALILTNTVLINRGEENNGDFNVTKTRLIIDLINAVIIFFTTLYPQYRILMEEKQEYFNHFTNFNQLLYMMLFAAKVFLDFRRLQVEAEDKYDGL